MQIEIVPAEEFGRAAARTFRRLLGAAPQPRLLLPTGGTPVPLYHALNDEGWNLPAETEAYALDEYCWPDAAHPGTNASYYREHLNPWSGAPSITIPCASAPDPAAEIYRHCRTLAQAPVTLAVLGIGPNGHIAFNEPPSGPDAPCRVVPLSEATRAALAPAWPDPPHHAMTTGMREILAAEHLLLLASGAAKAEVLAGALRGPVTPDLPASLLQRHLSVTVVCDEAAGRQT